jgi:hypothetical protein
MHLDKRQLLDALRADGRTRHLTKAEEELPSRIDTDEHADLLRALGVRPSELGELAARSQETGGFGGFGGPGARIGRLGR